MAKLGEKLKPVKEENWEEMLIRVPMRQKDYEQKAEELATVQLNLDEAQADLYSAKERVKEIRAKKDYLVELISSKQRELLAPCYWVFNWETSRKKLFAKLEDGEIFPSVEQDITFSDRQMKIRLDNSNETIS